MLKDNNAVTPVRLETFADDICIVANCEDNLQIMLNCVQRWCKLWRVLISNKWKPMFFAEVDLVKMNTLLK